MFQQHSLFSQPSPNVVGGPRCGEYWPAPSSASQHISAYVDLSDSGVCCLYVYDHAGRRWAYRTSTSKEKLIEEYRRRIR